MVDVLPTREAGPLAAWLTTHPGVEIICRDRAGAYTEGARIGAPDALHVADRFHLWKGLSRAGETRIAAHRDCLSAPSTTGPPQDNSGPPRPDSAGRRAERKKPRTPWSTNCSRRATRVGRLPGTWAGASPPS
ncbi:transposase [Streptomyces canus]|uniref:transposase n=1 Tax=Streptomyces canus TaxID=58343 RepID=UPI0033A83C66